MGEMGERISDLGLGLGKLVLNVEQGRGVWAYVGFWWICFIMGQVDLV